MLIGSVPYLNAIPLTHGLPVAIRTATPRELLAQLLQKELSLAMLSTVCLFQYPGLYLVPGMGIGSRGAVQSVRVFFNRPWGPTQNLTNFTPSPESNTANILAQLLLQQVPTPQQVTGTCCELVIGDRALTHPDPYGSVDLGQWWWEWTGLPFVFAAWVSRHPQIPRSLWEELMATKAHNLANLDACIAASPLLPEWSHEAKRHYLQDNIHYDFGDAEMLGLRRFREECISSGLIPGAYPIKLATIS